MVGNITMTKVNYTREDALVFIEYLSKKSDLQGSGKMPAFIKGYLSCMLVELAEASPKVKKILANDVNRVKREEKNGSVFA